MKKKLTNWDFVDWTEFQEATRIVDPAVKHYIDRKIEMGTKLYMNSIYQVEVEELQCPPPFGRCVYLSFKTLDKQARHDWREMQRIKNELVGPEVEAVEVYPAESRLVDTSNQYHLYCFPELQFEKGRLPFGFDDRIVAEGSDPDISKTGKGSRQRDFRPEFRPPDLVRGEVLRKVSRDPHAGIGGHCPQDGSPLVYKGNFVMNNGRSSLKAHKAECMQEKHVCFFLDKKEVDDAERKEAEDAARVPEAGEAKQ